jgi:hypothetical protein
MSSKTVAELLTFPFTDILGNKIPLIDVFIECPSLNSMVKVKGLLDTGSRYTLLERNKALYCFNDLESRYYDLVFINGALNKRYTIFIKIGSLEFKVPISLMDFQRINLPVVPEIILGREGLLEKLILIFYKNNFITLYGEKV